LEINVLYLFGINLINLANMRPEKRKSQSQEMSEISQGKIPRQKGKLL